MKTVPPASCVDLLQLSDRLPHLCALPCTELDGGDNGTVKLPLTFAVITLVPRVDQQSYAFPNTASALLVLLRRLVHSSVLSSHDARFLSLQIIGVEALRAPLH
jgi:hypothetical protein